METSNITNEVKEELIQIKDGTKLKNIKSKYIINEIFDFLRTKKSLEMVRYSRNFKKN